jgi:hypothetical protein
MKFQSFDSLQKERKREETPDLSVAIATADATADVRLPNG